MAKEVTSYGSKSVSERLLPEIDVEKKSRRKSKDKSRSKKDKSVLMGKRIARLDSFVGVMVTIIIGMKSCFKRAFCCINRNIHKERYDEFKASFKHEYKKSIFNRVRVVCLLLVFVGLGFFVGNTYHQHIQESRRSAEIEQRRMNFEALKINIADEEAEPVPVVQNERGKITKAVEIEFACTEYSCIEKCAAKMSSKCKTSAQCVQSRVKYCKKKCRKTRCEKRCELEPSLGYVEREMKVEKCKEGCQGSEKCKERCDFENRTCKQKCGERHRKFVCDRQLDIPTLSSNTANTIITEDTEDDTADLGAENDSETNDEDIMDDFGDDTDSDLDSEI